MGENQTAQSEIGSKPMNGNNNKEGSAKMRKNLKCWGCGEPHLLRYCAHRNIQTIQILIDETTINDVARNIHTINTVLEN